MTPVQSDGVVPGSFRDPSGFLFRHDGALYRQVNLSFREHYDHLLSSGLYTKLIERNQLIPHGEVGLERARSDEVYRIIQPQLVDFISYPYEWCVSQLKDAALATPSRCASELLPLRTKLKFSLLSHIHLHAKSQRHFADKKIDQRKARVSRLGLSGLIDNLKTTIRGLTWRPEGTEWGAYYDDTNYTSEGLAHKKELVGEYIDTLHPETLWDLGGNVGLFSRIASDSGAIVVSLDIDPAAVELNYLETKRRNEENLLPLINDLTNPSPAIGWCHIERV